MSRSEADLASSSHNNSAAFTVARPEFALHQITTFRSSCDEDFERLEKSSISAIGLWKRKLADLDETQLVQRLMSSGLSVSSLSFIGGFTGSSGEVFQEALDEAYESLFLAASLQAGCVVIAPGSRGRYTAKHEKRLVCSAIRELAFVADELNINLALLGMRQPFARSWTYLHSLDEVLGTLDVVNHPRVGIAFDTFHLLDDAIMQRVPEFASRIKHVQLSDRLDGANIDQSRQLPGDGDLPLTDFVRQLRDVGYEHSFDIHVWSNDVWSTPAEDVVQRCEDWIRALPIDVNAAIDVSVS